MALNDQNNLCIGAVQISNDNFSTCMQVSKQPTGLENKTSFVFSPNDYLSSGAKYTAKISGSVKDASGNSLGTDFTQASGFSTSNDASSSGNFDPTLIVKSTLPSDGTYSVARDTNISVTFNRKMNPSTVDVNFVDTSCRGAIQVSDDDFTSCIPMKSAPDVSNDNKTYTVKPISS